MYEKVYKLFLEMKMRLAITMGDPGGIGPEIALKAVCGSKWPASVRFVLIGAAEVWRKYAHELHLSRAVEFNNADNTAAGISVLDPAPASMVVRAQAGMTEKNWRAGKTGPAQGRAALLWIRAAAAGCRTGAFDGMVTGPICKSSIQAAGCSFPGHTEYLAHLANVKTTAMMLIGGPLRVVLATRHIPLKRVPAALTGKTVIEAITAANLAVQWLGLRQKTIGVCALNPHAGDQGMLGDEERKVITPAIRRLRRQGLKIKGIIPADVIFHQALKNKFGVVVAMYHDQGLGPLKMLFFERGVNLTLGLPFVRTSPDHGTAFDIAGKSLASPESMLAAINLAVKLARRPNPWKK